MKFFVVFQIKMFETLAKFCVNFYGTGRKLFINKLECEIPMKNKRETRKFAEFIIRLSLHQRSPLWCISPSPRCDFPSLAATSAINLMPRFWYPTHCWLRMLAVWGSSLLPWPDSGSIHPSLHPVPLSAPYRLAPFSGKRGAGEDSPPPTDRVNPNEPPPRTTPPCDLRLEAYGKEEKQTHMQIKY